MWFQVNSAQRVILPNQTLCLLTLGRIVLYMYCMSNKMREVPLTHECSMKPGSGSHLVIPTYYSGRRGRCCLPWVRLSCDSVDIRRSKTVFLPCCFPYHP